MAELSPGVESDEPVRGQSEADGMLDQGLGQDERRLGRGLEQVGHRSGVEMVGMLVAREDQVDSPEVRPPARGACHPDVGLVRPFVLRGQVLGKIGVDDHRPGWGLHDVSALAEPPDGERSRFRVGRVHVVNEFNAGLNRLDHRAIAPRNVPPWGRALVGTSSDAPR